MVLFGIILMAGRTFYVSNLKDASHTNTIKDAGITGADDGRVDVRDLILHAFRDDQRVRHSIFPQFEARGRAPTNQPDQLISTL